ncbi:MAG TPA: glycosyltransferase, partial [Solirubrobacterales bacterium]|nr:glycosyltransferase [Solirubrobacterales bacterium]
EALDAREGRSFSARLARHSRNFGSFAAIRTGLGAASGEYVAVMAADLQEPPSLIERFFEALEGGEDIVVGTRTGRADPWPSRVSSRLFWALYRRFVWREMPVGGVDVFGCTREFANRLLELREANTSLVTLVLWLGYQRAEIPYERLPRAAGKSAWSFRRKLRYLSDSVYSFTDLPIRVLLFLGIFGVLSSILVATTVAVARLAGAIDVPGYAATVIVVALLGAINLFALGIIGAYVWRGYENTKGRPDAVVMSEVELTSADREAPMPEVLDR